MCDGGVCIGLRKLSDASVRSLKPPDHRCYPAFLLGDAESCDLTAPLSSPAATKARSFCGKQLRAKEKTAIPGVGGTLKTVLKVIR